MWVRLIQKAVKAFLQSEAAAEDQQRAETRAANWTAGATVAIAFFTLASLGIGASQYIAMRGQQSVMQGQLDAMQAEQRPWIFVVDRVPYGQFVFSPPTGAILHIIYSLQDTGQTPGVSVHIRMHFFDDTNGWGLDPAKIQKWACDSKQERGIWDSAKITVFPGKPQPLDTVVILGQDKIDRITRGDKPPAPKAAIFRGVLNGMIVGCVKYSFASGIGGVHATPFSYFLSGPPVPAENGPGTTSLRLIAGAHNSPASNLRLMDFTVGDRGVKTN